MTALRLATTPPQELAHTEREAAAYSLFLSAAQRGDTTEANRLWALYAQIHAQRPAVLVERLEIEKGLR